MSHHVYCKNGVAQSKIALTFVLSCGVHRFLSESSFRCDAQKQTCFPDVYKSVNVPSFQDRLMILFCLTVSFNQTLISNNK